MKISGFTALSMAVLVLAGCASRPIPTQQARVSLDSALLTQLPEGQAYLVQSVFVTNGQKKSRTGLPTYGDAGELRWQDVQGGAAFPLRTLHQHGGVASSKLAHATRPAALGKLRWCQLATDRCWDVVKLSGITPASNYAYTLRSVHEDRAYRNLKDTLVGPWFAETGFISHTQFARISSIYAQEWRESQTQPQTQPRAQLADAAPVSTQALVPAASNAVPTPAPAARGITSHTASWAEQERQQRAEQALRAQQAAAAREREREMLERARERERQQEQAQPAKAQAAARTAAKTSTPTSKKLTKEQAEFEKYQSDPRVQHFSNPLERALAGFAIQMADDDVEQKKAALRAAQQQEAQRNQAQPRTPQCRLTSVPHTQACNFNDPLCVGSRTVWRNEQVCE